MTLQPRFLNVRRLFTVGIGAALAASSLAIQEGARSDDAAYKSLKGHIPPIVATSRPVARVAPAETVHLALSLPLHNEAALDDLLRHLYTPGDPQQGDFLTPQTFASRFGPSEADYAAVTAYAAAYGLKIEQTHSNRLVLDISGPAASVERAFGTRLLQYQDKTGRIFRAPAQEPVVPAALASRISAVVGLDTAQTWRPHYRVQKAANGNGPVAMAGSGPAGGLSPADIKNAYGLSGTPLTGTGQTLALFELDGYNPSDITTYETTFGLPNVPLKNVLVDGATGAAGSGAVEVVLDIELMTALAPGAQQIMVYEGPNSGQGVIDTYNRIATDNIAKQISTSWGLDEGSSG